MRILLDYRPALRQRTGVGEYAHELARALMETSPGSDEQLALFSASWKDRLAADVVPGAVVLDRQIPNRALNLLWHRWEWPAVEMLAPGAFAVVHAFHPLLIPTRGAAQVVTITDLDFVDHPARTEREIRRDYPALAGDHTRRAHHVVTISHTTSAAIRERLQVPPERITVCPPGAPAWTRRDREPANGCLLFLGTLEARKNLGVLLDAYERLLHLRPDAPPLVLAGRPTDAAGELVARTTRPPLAGHVELPGYIADDAREALYRRALVFIMPSHNEGFGMPVLEAMTVGVPVVVANRGALPEVAGDAARFFEPDDPTQLATILAELLSDPGARQGMREAGWRRSEAFVWRESAARLRHAWAAAQLDQRSRRG